MARVDVLMPQMGESIAEGTLSKWLKKVGDPVTRDEPLFEISTDNVDAAIPAAGAGISASTLSVEISNSGSSRFTGSPTFLSHLLKVPSAIDSPICGINTSTRAIVSPSVGREPTCGFYNVVGLRQHEVLKRGRVWQRHIVRRHAHDWPVEPLERLLVDPRRNLARNATRPRVLVHDQHLVRLLHGRDDGRVVQR